MELLRRIAAWLGARRRADELADEIEAHRLMAQDELERAGLTSSDAADESRRRMGNVTIAREESREVWTVRWLDRLRLNARYGLRGLRREPLFALTAVVTLAVGIATTTTVFSVVDAEVWRPLPYPDPHRLVEVRSKAATGRGGTDEISIDELLAWRRAPSLGSLASSTEGSRVTIQLDGAQSLVAQGVTANYFATLGRPAQLGRVFTDEDALGADAAILTERGWTRVFAHDTGVIGRTVMVDSRPTTIIGVVADDESTGFNPDLFLPIDEREPAAAKTRVYGAVGRLADGATGDIARAQVQAIIAQRAATDPERRHHVAVVEDLSSYHAVFDHRSLYFFLGAAALVLLLTVVNTAGLILSRLLRRAPEFALRGALGGGTRAVAVQLAVEAALIVVPACLLALWMTSQALGAVGAVVPDTFLERGPHIPLDLRVVLCCAGLAMATIAGLAVVPLRLARRIGSGAIGGGSRSSAGRTAGRTRTALLTAQLALTVVLLAGAGVFLQAFVTLLHVPLGFEPTSAWSARIALSGPRYARNTQVRAYVDGLLSQARAIPGVRFAGVATSSPLGSGYVSFSRDARRPAVGQNADGQVTIFRAVGGDYFAAIGTPILRGRALESSDAAGTPAVAVVNQQLALAMFAGEDPVGKTIIVTGRPDMPVTGGVMTIVGVASNIKEIRPNEGPIGDVYVPFAQHPDVALELVVRGADDASLVTSLRAAAAVADPAIPVTSVTTLASRVTKSLKGERFNLALVAGFAMAALLVAAIGLYGAMAYAATSRWREFGVRLALGATPRGLIGLALWQAVRLGVAGGLAGVAGSLTLAIWLGNALNLVPGQHNGPLYTVKPTDPIALGAALAGVLVLSIVAGAIPARRVARIDPVRALRAD